MHILIIPSEEFVPENDHLAGIFQWHQAEILKENDYKVGALSINQSFSPSMILKGLIYKCIGKKIGNEADNYSLSQLVKLGYNKIFSVHRFIKKENKNGIDIYRINGFFYTPPKENKNHYGWIKAGLAAYKQYVKDFGKPDLIHAHNAIYAGMLADKIHKLYKVPFVLTEHSTAFARGNVTDKSLIKKIKKSYESSILLFAVSEPFCSLLNNFFNINKFQCLPNVLDSFLEKQTYKTRTNTSNEFVFLNIAELHPKKDHMTLLNAFNEVLKVNDKARLWLAGGGVLEQQLKQYVKDMNLENYVSFLGVLGRQGVQDAILSAQCFVLSSIYETFGVVVIEAMLFGVPVIVTRCGGPEAFVNSQVGIVVEKSDPIALKNAMLSMMSNYKEFDRPTEIRQATIEQFGRQKFLRRINKIYHQATA